MKGLVVWLAKAAKYIAAEMAGQAIGLLALVAGLFAWAYSSSGYIAAAVVIIGLMAAGWVATLPKE